MPADNIYHDLVVQALIADGWIVTDDPLTVAFGGRDMYVDLAAHRRTFAAERSGRKIAVEIQSFLSPSPVRDLQEAVGQYDVYRAVLAETNPERQLYMAVPQRVQQTLLSEVFGQLIVKRVALRVLVFDEKQPRIVQWIE